MPVKPRVGDSCYIGDPPAITYFHVREVVWNSDGTATITFTKTLSKAQAETLLSANGWERADPLSPGYGMR